MTCKASDSHGSCSDIYDLEIADHQTFDKLIISSA